MLPCLVSDSITTLVLLFYSDVIVIKQSYLTKRFAYSNMFNLLPGCNPAMFAYKRVGIDITAQFVHRDFHVRFWFSNRRVNFRFYFTIDFLENENKNKKRTHNTIEACSFIIEYFQLTLRSSTVARLVESIFSLNDVIGSRVIRTAWISARVLYDVPGSDIEWPEYL